MSKLIRRTKKNFGAANAGSNIGSLADGLGHWPQQQQSANAPAVSQLSADPQAESDQAQTQAIATK